MNGAVGAALVVLSGAGFGLAALRELDEALSSAREIKRMVEAMRTEVCCRMRPMPEVLAELARAQPELLRGAADLPSRLKERPFKAIWADWVSASDLPAPLRAVLLDLGNGLADGDPPEEVFRRCVTSLDDLIGQAAERRQRNGRLCLAAGLSLGGMIAILLL